MRVILNFWSCLLALPMHFLHFKVLGIPFSNPPLKNCVSVFWWYTNLQQVLEGSFSTCWQGAQTIGGETIICKNLQMSLWVQEVEYLGHIVSHEGAKIDPNKIKSIKEWKIPTTLRHIRGFLRLIEYYCKFVKNYGKIATPLTKLLKNDAFFLDSRSN